MTTVLEFGVYQFIAYSDFVATSLGWEQGDTLDLRLKGFEKFFDQAHGPVGVVSDNAVCDRYFEHVCLSSFQCVKIILLFFWMVGKMSNMRMNEAKIRISGLKYLIKRVEIL